MSVIAQKTELRRHIDRLKTYLLSCLAISFFMSILYLAPIGYMRDVYGPVINSRSIDTLLWVTALLVLLLATTGFLDWIRQRILLSASVHFAKELSPRIFDASFFANLYKIQGAQVGLTDLRLLRNFISSPVMGYVCDAPFGILFLILVFVIHPTMGYLSVLGAVLALVVGLWTEKRVRPLMSKAIENANAANAFIADSGRNAPVVQAMGMMGSVRKRWLAIQNRYLAQQAGASGEQAVGMATSKLVMAVQGSSLLGVGALLTLMGHLPPSAGAYLIIAKLLGAMAIRPTMQLITSWKQIVAARESYDRLNKFLNVIPLPAETMSMPAPQARIELTGVAARPPGTKSTVVSETTFQLNPGQILAIVGPSGSGKSSLARLLVGVWRPLLGSVRLDGVEISGWKRDEVGQYIGYLPQDVELFDGTFAENIARFGLIDSQKLDRAVALSGLSELVLSLERGLDTEIGDSGATLSGGQRQRVGIARALYGDPKLVVLDEPNSSLDKEGELVLAQAVLELKKIGSAVVVITHKKSFLKVSDLILVMAEGRPLMFGARDSVLRKLMEKFISSPSSEKAA